MSVLPPTDHRHCRDRVPARMMPLDQAAEALLEVLGQPEGQAALLEDLAEVSSDVVLLAAPETVVLRLSAVIEKVLELTADYLPGESLRVDKAAINIPIMATSMFLFSRSAAPIIQAQFVQLDELDQYAFEKCFAPVGVSLLQFKSMKATGCFDRIEYPPGMVLIDENDTFQTSPDGHVLPLGGTPDDWKFMYWLISGSVIRSFRGNAFNTVERTNGMHIDNPAAIGLLGDTRFLYNLEAERNAQQRQVREQNNIGSGLDYNESSSTMDQSRAHPMTTTTIGPKGSTMLRIDSHKLYDLMDHDERLESSIRLLLLKSLKRKVGNLLLAQEQKFDSIDAASGDGTEAHGSATLLGHEDNKLMTKPPL